MLNWKTTVSGIIAATPTILKIFGAGIPDPVAQAIMAIAVAVGFYVSKDATAGEK